MKKKEYKLFDNDSDNDGIETEKSGQNKKDIYNVENTRRIYNPAAAQKEAEAKQTAAWTAYQEAVVKCGKWTGEITKGIQSGEKPELLLLKAVKCISLMTDNALFYELNRENIKKAYGLDLPDLDESEK